MVFTKLVGTNTYTLINYKLTMANKITLYMAVLGTYNFDNSSLIIHNYLFKQHNKHCCDIFLWPDMKAESESMGYEKSIFILFQKLST